ncbi:Dor1-like family-domain-containing protein, partial [Fimicolochytrium jonesii]|uniref:Dor1-like family-domain-containing protein n=1 Tax=Fimicolochytrium jonesii TaxID=1396493 RepID=UPI0022FE7B2B
YLDHLTSCSLKTLKSEPAVLVRETARLQQQLADLAYTEYRSFLRANECTRDIKGTFSTMDEQLNALQASLPEVESACSSFATSSTESILKDRKRELLVLNQHSKLVEILEIPQLMDTLIRNGYYDEAMDLQTHVQRLLLRYPQHKILQSVGNELEATTKVMLMQLVNLLKGDVKLPLCIRVMGYLRRIEAVAEPELRLIFLQQRDKFFRKRVDDVCGKEGVGSGTLRDHAEYLRKYIDVCRECFFDIVAQYRAIFSDATATANTNGDTGIDSAAHVNFTSALLYDTASHSTLTHSILSSYMTDAAQVASICTQTMYFGMSLGRIGIDFRNVVRHVFEDAIETIVSRTIMDGTTQFLHWLHETTAEAANAITAAASADIAVPAFGSSRQNSSRHGAAQPLVSAPTSLLAHPPLAYLLNTFFNAFNHLRALPALSLRARIETLIEARLALCAEGLSDVVASVW